MFSPKSSAVKINLPHLILSSENESLGRQGGPVWLVLSSCLFFSLLLLTFLVRCWISWAGILILLLFCSYFLPFALLIERTCPHCLTYPFIFSLSFSNFYEHLVLWIIFFLNDILFLFNDCIKNVCNLWLGHQPSSWVCRAGFVEVCGFLSSFLAGSYLVRQEVSSGLVLWLIGFSVERPSRLLPIDVDRLPVACSLNEKWLDISLWFPAWLCSQFDFLSMWCPWSLNGVLCFTLSWK